MLARWRVWKLLVCIVCWTTGPSLKAQVDLTISSDPRWTDVTVRSSSHPSETGFANTNFRTHPRLAATVWIRDGAISYYRTLLRFDLSEIPAGSTLLSAQLILHPDLTTPLGEHGNESGSDDFPNSFVIKRVTSNWNPATVTWNTQPTSTPDRLVQLGWTTSTGIVTSYINIADFVSSMIESPATNFGLVMEAEEEWGKRSRNYASSDFPDASRRPQLKIRYVPLYWCVKDGHWQDAIWSTDPQGTTGVPLPAGAAANIAGHAVTLKGAATVRRLQVLQANGKPGVLTVDGGQLTSTQQVTVANDHAGNSVKLLHQGKVLVNE